MIDDQHDDKSSNHPAREVNTQLLLLFKNGMLLCVCVGSQTDDICVYLSSTPPCLTVKPSRCSLAEVCACVYMCVWPLDHRVSPATTAERVCVHA